MNFKIDQWNHGNDNDNDTEMYSIHNEGKSYQKDLLER